MARFDAAGNANTANKLTHARTFLTDLAAVAATNFDSSADNVHGVTGILPVASGGTGRTDGRSYMPAGIIVFTASYNPESQRLVPLDGRPLTNAYVAGNKYYDLAQCFPSNTGGFVRSGNNLRLPNYEGLFLRGSGSQTITEYGDFPGTHNGGNIGEKHGDAMRKIVGTHAVDDYHYADGVFYTVYEIVPGASGTGDGRMLKFDNSRVVPTDDTTHPAFGVGRICISY